MALMDVFTHFSIIRRARRGIRPEEIKKIVGLIHELTLHIISIHTLHELEARGNALIFWILWASQGFPFIRFTNWKQVPPLGWMIYRWAVSIHTLHELEASFEDIKSIYATT